MTTGNQRPQRFTEFGEKIAKALNAGGWAERTTRNMWQTVVNLEDDAVQDYCHKLIVRDLSVKEQWGSLVENLAYEHRTTAEEIYKVLALVLRDKMLEVRAESSGQSTTE